MKRIHYTAWLAGLISLLVFLAPPSTRSFSKGTLVIDYEHGDLAHLDSTIPQCVAAFDKITAEDAKE